MTGQVLPMLRISPLQDHDARTSGVVYNPTIHMPSAPLECHGAYAGVRLADSEETDC
jgi:hypothetical protein